MADVLVELGRTDFGRAETASISPLEDFVASWENPAVGILRPDLEIPAPKAKILARIRAVSAMVRSKLVANPETLPAGVRPRPSWWHGQLKGFDGLSDSDCDQIWKCFPSLKPFTAREFERCKEPHPEGSFTGREGTYPLPPERANYPALLHGYISALGSFQLGSLSDFFKKIGKTVTSPMGVSMLGAAAGLIPFGATTGKIASVALGGLTLARVGKSARARVFLVLGELRQHDADAARLRLLRLRLGSGSLGNARCRLGLFHGLRRVRADRPALLLLDQNGLRAPVAEALPHMAGLHRPAHVERHLAPSASGLAFSLVGLTHSLSVSDPFWLANAALPLR